MDPVLAKIDGFAETGAWAEAEAWLLALSMDPGSDPEACGSWAESLAHRAGRAGLAEWAKRFNQLALAAFEQHASWATSGCEGLGRMVHVNRLLERLGRPRR